jgi:transposase
VDAALLVESPRDFGIELVGPTRANYKWQAKQQTGFAAEHFTIDWERQEATCPEGHTSSSWTPAIDRGKNPVIKLKFSTTDCQKCPSFRLCTTSVRHRRRTLTVRPYEQYLALQGQRQQQKTEAFKAVYARRAGVEGTMAQGVRSCGMRRSRYLGQPRTHLQHVGIAAAINMVRVTAWLAGTPVAKTRVPPFLKLMTKAA